MYTIADSRSSKLQKAYRRLRNASGCRSLLKKHLTETVFEELSQVIGPHGLSLLDVIRSGCINLDSAIGAYAPHPASYDLFPDLFDPIIEDYHGFSRTDTQPAPDFGDPDALIDLDPNNELIISTRVRCCRSIAGYPLAPLMTESDLRDVAFVTRKALAELPGELRGSLMPLAELSQETRDELARDHLLFGAEDRFLQAGNAYAHWPTGRGVFCNRARTFAVWVNEEDHLRIMSIQKGADLRETYGRFVRAVRSLESKLVFARHARLGYLTTCPTNLGTTIRASVLIRLPKLGEDEAKLKAVAGTYGLQIRGTHGEHSKSDNCAYDVSNKKRLGAAEIEVITDMQRGVLKLIEHEKSLE